MATIALNWELGADYGHVSRFKTIAQELKQRGHRPICILRDISRAEELLGGSSIDYLQAPIWQAKTQGLPADLNFTETLLRFGFLQPEGLLAMVKAWRQLWRLIGADLIMLDLAPSAGLAARGLGIPRILVGNSYSVPPKLSPLPAFRWWQKLPAEHHRLRETEERVLRNINLVAKRQGIPLLDKVSDLFSAEQRLSCSIPELDVYGPGEDRTYIGPINSISMGTPPHWPSNDKPRIFAYLKPHYRHFDAVIEAMRATDASFLIFAPGLSAATEKRYAHPNLVFSDTPFHMGDTVRSCHLVICHAGGTTDVALMNGKPLLQLPMQMEQTMTSRRTEMTGAGLYLPLDGNPGDLRRMLKRVISTPAFTEAAEAYAQRHSAFCNEKSLAQLLCICEETLATQVAST